MSIPREYATSNPIVRDALALIPPPRGTRAGDFVAPDFRVDAEVVDVLTVAAHDLNLDDARAADAMAKAVQFETGSTAAITVTEHALTNTMDSRKIEEAANRDPAIAVNLVTERLSLLRDDILDVKEYLIAQLTMGTSTYAGDHQTNAVNWRTADLFSTIEAAQEFLVSDGDYPGTRLLLGKTAWAGARLNAEFGKFVAGPTIKPGASELTLARFAEYLGLDEVRVADFRRKIAGVSTQFWPVTSALLFAENATLSNRTLAQTPVCPYGPEQGNSGALVDARTAAVGGTALLTEVGAYHRYRPLIRNASLGFLWTNVSKA